MSTEIHSNPIIRPLSEAPTDFARRAANGAEETARTATAAAKDFVGVVEDRAKDVGEATKYAAQKAADTAKEFYQSAALKAGDTLSTSKEYMRRNPVPVILGAIAFGAALGYMLVMARRKPTFSERCVDEPLASVRGAIMAALTPVAQRVHEEYDAARDGAGKLLDRVHRFNPGRTADSLSDQLGRVGSNLKFW